MYHKNNNIDDNLVANYESSLRMAQTNIVQAWVASSSMTVDTQLNYTVYETICPPK